MKSLGTAEGTSTTDVSRTIASELQKQNGTKDSLKSQAKEGHILLRDISPTATDKVGKKVIEGKSEDDTNPVITVNGGVMNKEEFVFKTAHQMDRDSGYIKNEGQEQEQINPSLASNILSPILFLSRKNCETTETSGTNWKNETTSDGFKTIDVDISEPQEVTPVAGPKNERLPPVHKSPKKGKTMQSQNVVCGDKSL